MFDNKMEVYLQKLFYIYIVNLQPFLVIIAHNITQHLVFILPFSKGCIFPDISTHKLNMGRPTIDFCSPCLNGVTRYKL